MKNILSYTNNVIFTGEEILSWSQYQLNNNTSHYKQAKWFLSHFIIKKDSMYYISFKEVHERQRNTRMPFLIKVKCPSSSVG